MKTLFGGTLVLTLAALLSAAPQTPATGGTQTPQKQTEKKPSKRKHDKTQTQSGDKHHKSGKSDKQPTNN